MTPNPTEMGILAALVISAMVFRRNRRASKRRCVAECFDRIEVGTPMGEVRKRLREIGLLEVEESAVGNGVRTRALLPGDDVVVVIEYSRGREVVGKTLHQEKRQPLLRRAWWHMTGQ